MNEPYVLRCFDSLSDRKAGRCDHRRKHIEQKVVEEVHLAQARSQLQYALKTQAEKKEKFDMRVAQVYYPQMQICF